MSETALSEGDLSSHSFQNGDAIPASVVKEEEESFDGYYCRTRNFDTVEIQCSHCAKWVPKEHVKVPLGNMLPFMTNYTFMCKNCGFTKGTEDMKMRPPTLGQMCATALANIIYKRRNDSNPKKMFNKDKDIAMFIDTHWDSMTTAPRRVKSNWRSAIGRTMLRDPTTFTFQEVASCEPIFGLVEKDLSKIGPVEEAKKMNLTIIRVPEVKPPPNESKSRGAKRKASEGQSSQQKRRADVARLEKAVPLQYPMEHPFNKDGYRYHLAEPDPFAPDRQAFDESLDWAGKPIPGHLYRLFLPTTVTIAPHDRAPQLKLKDDRIVVTGDKGYSMARATHGVNRGTWYFEIVVLEMPLDSAARVGWSQAVGNLQAPCGFDKFSYSWRSKKGTRFHESRGRHYCDSGYGEGDIIGLLISLPEPNSPSRLLPPTYKDKPLIKFKNFLYYEEKDNVQDMSKLLVPLPGCKIAFYKNGVNQGVAWEDICEGIYFPTVSLYKNATLMLNFGPDFKYPPKDVKNWQPMSDSAEKSMVEHALGDIVYHVSHENKWVNE